MNFSTCFQISDSWHEPSTALLLPQAASISPRRPFPSHVHLVPLLPTANGKAVNPKRMSQTKRIATMFSTMPQRAERRTARRATKVLVEAPRSRVVVRIRRPRKNSRRHRIQLGCKTREEGKIRGGEWLKGNIIGHLGIRCDWGTTGENE